MNFKLSECLLSTNQSISIIPSSSTSSSPSWSGLGLDFRLIRNIDLEAQLLDHRIISTILNIHHTELYLPPQSNSSIAYLIGIINSTIINSYQSTESHSNSHPNPSSQNQINPSTLLISLSSNHLDQLHQTTKTLTQGIHEISLYDLKDTTPLSDTITDLQKNPTPNLLLSSLNRLLLLHEKGFLNFTNLKILTIDLRLQDSVKKINHHLITELNSLLTSMDPSVQLIFILPTTGTVDEPKPHSKLSFIIDQAINRSIHFNTLHQSSLLNSCQKAVVKTPTESQITASNTSFNSRSSNLGCSSEFSTPNSSLESDRTGGGFRLDLPKELSKEFHYQFDFH